MEENKIINAIIITDKDNVVTAITNLKKGETVRFLSEKKLLKEFILKHDIPFGHKAAVIDIACKNDVIKYGESIGRTTKDILLGQHVHIQNLESKRGRGDLK